MNDFVVLKIFEVMHRETDLSHTKVPVAKVLLEKKSVFTTKNSKKNCKVTFQPLEESKKYGVDVGTFTDSLVQGFKHVAHVRKQQLLLPWLKRDFSGRLEQSKQTNIMRNVRREYLNV